MSWSQRTNKLLCGLLVHSSKCSDGMSISSTVSGSVFYIFQSCVYTKYQSANVYKVIKGRVSRTLLIKMHTTNDQHYFQFKNYINYNQITFRHCLCSCFKYCIYNNTSLSWPRINKMTYTYMSMQTRSQEVRKWYVHTLSHFLILPFTLDMNITAKVVWLDQTA